MIRGVEIWPDAIGENGINVEAPKVVLAVQLGAPEDREISITLPDGAMYWIGLDEFERAFTYLKSHARAEQEARS